MAALEPGPTSTIPAETLVLQEEMEDIVFEETTLDETSDLTEKKSEQRYNLRSQAQRTESDDVEENIEESDEENNEGNDEELQSLTNLENVDFDTEDLKGASLDDALDTIEGKYIPEHIAKYSNDVYHDFMELVIEGNISNKIGDKIIRFFNKHSALNESPLPTSTKNGKDYLNQINSPSIDFKEKVVMTYNKVDFTLHYRPIFRAIQVLIQRSEVADNFVTKGILKKDNRVRIFGELYEGNW